MASYGFKIEVEGNAIKSIKGIEDELSLLGNKSKEVHDKIDKSFAKIGESVKGFGANIKSLAIGGLGIGGLLGGMDIAHESLEAFDKYEEGVSKLEAVLTSTRHAAGLTIDELKESAKGLSSQTLFGRSAIMDAQSMLLTFTAVRGVIFDQAMPAVADFATRFKMDMPEAANMLGKALNDPLKGMTKLQREGVVFSDQQKKTIEQFMEHGQVAKAQGVILKELGTEFGGLAKAMANTDAGKIKMANKALGEMKLTIGEMLSKGLVAMSPAIVKIGEAFKDAFGTKASDAMKESRIEMVSLFETLKDQNIPLDQKREIMDKLNSQYSEYIPKLLTEKMTTEDFAKAENLANEAMLRKIQIQANRELYEGYFKSYSKAAENLVKVREKIEEEKLTTEENKQKYKGVDGSARESIRHRKIYEDALNEETEARNMLNKQLKALNLATGYKGESDFKKEGVNKISEEIDGFMKNLDKNKNKNSILKDEMAGSALNTSALGGASGGLGEAKVIKIDFHKALMEVNVPGGNGMDIVSKAPMSVEMMLRIINNLSMSQGSTM